MTLTLTQVRQISADVAGQQHPPLDVIAAAPVGERAEVILTVRGCKVEPCHVVVGVSRNASEQEFRELVNARLHDHLTEHRHDASARSASEGRG